LLKVKVACTLRTARENAGFLPLLNEVAQHALHNMDHLVLIGLQSEIEGNRSKRLYYF